MQRATKPGIKLIKSFEGVELEAYQDIAGVWTIGYGHTRTAHKGMAITQQEANRLFAIDLSVREEKLRIWSKMYGVPLNQNEFNALVSFIYNVGFTAFSGSTAAKRLRKGDRVGAAGALLWWNKATVNGALVEVLGLTRRRAAERAMFLMPVEAGSVHRESNARPPKEARPILASPLFDRKIAFCDRLFPQ